MRLNAFLLTAVSFTAAYATENDCSIYPICVETVMPGALPDAGQSVFLEYTDFYRASALADGKGRNVVPGFHLAVNAFALRIMHNWGVHALGGTLVSSVALPFLDMQLEGPFGKDHQTGLGNTDLGLYVAYGKGPWHWWYGLDGSLPGPEYNKSDLLHVGQHNLATALSGAISYLPGHAQTEISSKFEYIRNFTDPATFYRSGDEFIWEYAAMRNVAGKLALGLNGYFYRQVTDDLENRYIVDNGNRGQTVALGPQVRYALGRAALILKYQREMLVENRAVGNSLWFEIGVPVGRRD